MKAVLVVIIFSLTSLFLHAEKLCEFKEPFTYVIFAMDDDQIYIADRGTNIVHIYSRENYSHIAQFGGLGQGPAEFETIAFLRAYPDYVYVSAGRKVSFYSKKGKFIETKTPFPNSGGYLPLGKNYVCKKYGYSRPEDERGKYVVELLNSKFQTKKDLFVLEFQKYGRYNFQTGKEDILMIRDCMKLDVYEDMLFIGNTDKGFFFSVFNSEGRRLYVINHPYEIIIVTSKDKKIVMDNMRESFGEGKFNDWKIKCNPVFPKYYPAYSDFMVTDGKIYVFSYPRLDYPQELLTLDLKGNLSKSVEVPKVEDSYTIYKEAYYYIKYNDKTYLWELHVQNLK